MINNTILRILIIFLFTFLTKNKLWVPVNLLFLFNSSFSRRLGAWHSCSQQNKPSLIRLGYPPDPLNILLQKDSMCIFCFKSNFWKLHTGNPKMLL